MIQNPPSLGFGGGHVQALMYKKYIREIGVGINFVDFSDGEDNFEILHILGMQAGNCLNGMNAKRIGKKIVLSSIFYTEANVLLYGLVNRIMSTSFFSFFQNRFFLMQKLIDSADYILPNSTAEAMQLKKIFKIDKSKIKVVYNGVEPELFHGVDRNLFTEKFRVDSGFVLSVANINRRKNTLNLIKAFIESNLNTKLVLIGNFNYEADASYCAEVKRMIEKNSDKILLINNLHYGDKMLLSAYLNARVHVLASTLETPGLANLEAALAGCNLVVGDCAPVREYFGDRVLYCGHENIADIKEKIILAYHNGLNNDLSEFIVKKYSWQNIAREVVNTYRSL